MTDQLMGLVTADAVLGIVLVVLGLHAGARRLSRNKFTGIAIPSALVSDEAWFAGHEAAAPPLVQGGAYGVLGGLLSAVAFPTWGPWIACGVFAAVLGHVFGAILLCDKAAKAVAPAVSAGEG